MAPVAPGMIDRAKLRLEWNLGEALYRDGHRVSGALGTVAAAIAAGRPMARGFLQGAPVSLEGGDRERRGGGVRASCAGGAQEVSARGGAESMRRRRAPHRPMHAALTAIAVFSILQGSAR